MADSNEGTPGNIWASQNARLGSFLVGSSFLIAAFIQLVTAENVTLEFLIHSIAALGSLIAVGYFLMNFWLVSPTCLPKWMRKDEPSTEQVVHTWLVPLLFLIFWIVAWTGVNEYSPIRAAAISVGILLLIFSLFIPIQKCRDRHSQEFEEGSIDK